MEAAAHNRRFHALQRARVRHIHAAVTVLSRSCESRAHKSNVFLGDKQKIYITLNRSKMGRDEDDGGATSKLKAQKMAIVCNLQTTNTRKTAADALRHGRPGRRRRRHEGARRATDANRPASRRHVKRRVRGDKSTRVVALVKLANVSLRERS